MSDLVGNPEDRFCREATHTNDVSVSIAVSRGNGHCKLSVTLACSNLA